MAATAPVPETQTATAAQAPRANPYVQTIGGILVAVLTTTVSSTLGASPTANLVVAVLGAVLPTFVTYVGPWRRLRLGVAATAALAALFVTFGGLTLFDAAADEKTVPWSAPDKATVAPTFAPAGGGGGGQALVGRHVRVTRAVDCTPDGCDRDVVIRNVGTEPIRVLNPEITGDDAGSFAAQQTCAGQEVASGDSCRFAVTYTPRSNQAESATLLVHHNVGPDPSPVRLTGSGGADAVSGNVAFTDGPACARAGDGSLVVTGTVGADAGAGQVGVAVLSAADESPLASGRFTVGQQGTVPLPEGVAGATVRVRLDPDGAVQGNDPNDDSTDVTCPA